MAATVSGDVDAPPADQGLQGVKPDPPLDRGERRKRRWSWLATGHRAEPTPSRLGVLEPFDGERIGVCCSGGGIRSASFNLGALQALRHDSELGKAKYLAAVSGGSYIAGGLCMVAKTWPASAGAEPPEGDGHDDSDPSLVTTKALPFHPGSPEEQYLRNRSTYMAPTRLDKLFLAWRVLLGLVLNLVLVGLPLFAIGTLLALVLYRSDYGLPGGAPFAANEPGWVWWLLLGSLALAAALGFVSLLTRPKRDSTRRFLETWSLRMLLLTAVVAVVLVAVPELIALLQTVLKPEPGDPAAVEAGVTVPAVGAGGVGSLLLAALLELRSREAHPSAVAQDVGRARNVLSRASPRIRRAFVYVATLIAAPVLLLGIVVLAAYVASTPADMSTGIWSWGLVVPVIAFGFFYLVSDLNTWSLHPFYRRRLCSAFALKRVRVQEPEATNVGVPPVKAVERDFNRLVPLSKSGVWPGPSSEGWPTLLVCAAVNVSDPGATPPGRGVSSFTFSRDTIGGPLVGGIATHEYEKRLGTNRLRDITLPAAIAMSGAAISPSMGKATNVPLRMLMALANVRLGVWVPNPRHVARWQQRTVLLNEKRPEKRRSGIETPTDDRKERRPRDLSKHPRLSYLFRELIGRNRVDGKFLYITDGGHYENLGLVELLRRGCGKIYCFDASGGKPAAALGDAIALARSELGVEVTIDPTMIKLDDEGFAEDSVAIGTIKYGAFVGRLIYAPTVLTRKVPWDVRAYKDADPVFPHHSTGDQLYTDQRFEAYRALGEYAGERARAAMRSG